MFLSAFSLGCAALLAASVASAQTPPEIQIESELCFGHYRARGWVTVLVELENNGPDRQLEVALDGVGITRSVTVDLGARARRRLQLTAPAPRLGGLEVLVREAGERKVIGRDTVEMRRLGDAASLVAFLGERPPGLKERMDLSAPLTLEAVEDQLRVARATPSTLPESWLGYRSLDALVWAHPAWDQLNPAQAEALRRWVLEGGHLVVAVDDDWRQAGRGALGALLPAELTGVERLERGAEMLRLLGVGESFGASVYALPEQAQGLPKGEVNAWADAHPEEIKRYYEAHRSRLAVPQFKLRRIVLSLDPNAPNTYDRVNEVRQRLYDTPRSFGEIAKEVSEDPEIAAKGGDMGWVLSESLPLDTVERLRYINTVDNPDNLEEINTSDRVIFYRVEDRREEAPPLAELRASIARRLLVEERLAGTPELAGLPAQLPVLRAQPRAGARPADGVWSLEEPLAWTWEVGAGRVTLWRTGWERAGRTPSLEAWRGWLVQASGAKGNLPWATLQVDVPQIEINAYLLLLVLVIYVLVIGPVDYLVLRKLRRLELTVFTYTSSIVIFSGLAWLSMWLGQDNSTRMIQVQQVTWVAPDAVEGGAASPGGVQLVHHLNGYFTSTRQSVSLAAPPGDNIASPVADEWVAGALLDSQLLKGQPATLEVSAAAFAMLPIETDGVREPEGGPPVRVSWTTSAEDPRAVLSVESRLAIDLEACMLVHEGRASADWFALPAGGRVEAIRLRASMADTGRSLVPETNLPSHLWSLFNDMEQQGFLRRGGQDPGRGALLCVAKGGELLDSGLNLEAEELRKSLLLRVIY